MPGFSGAMLIFLLLCLAHKCSVLPSNAHYWHHFLTLQALRFASGFKTRWWWIISLPVAQNPLCEFPHILNFIHGTRSSTSSWTMRARKEPSCRCPAAGAFCSPPSIQQLQPGQGCTAPGHPARHHAQASSWKIQRKRVWQREKYASHNLSSQDGVTV